MSFLAPLFLFGALAVALPVVFHLIRRTTRERTPFSSLMFLFPTPPRLTRRSRLEHLLLLALRCLVLCLLALGFSRPFFQKAVSTPPPATARRVLLLVDQSASMRRSRLWLDAQEKVRKVLEQLGPADQAALFLFDRQVWPLVTFDQWNSAPAGERSALLAQKLAGKNPGWASTRLDAALIQAAETLADAAGKSGRAGGEIVLISDMQEGSRFEQLQGYEWPKQIKVTIEALKPKHTGNASLQLVADPGTGNPDPAGVRVRVSNTRDSKVEQFRVGWAASNHVSVAGATVQAYVPPGQSRVVTLPFIGGQPAERILLAGDGQDFDNAIYTLPLERAQLTVLYLGEDSASDPKQPLFFLQRALQQTRQQAVEVRARAPGALLSATELGAASLIIVAGPLPPELGKAVQAQLSAGKTGLCLLRNEATSPTLATLLGVDRVPATEARLDSNKYAMLGEIDFRDALFAPFADPRFSDFTKIHFWRYRRIDSESLPNSRVLARFDNGDPAMLEVPVGKGRLLVLTSGWQPEDSQLALSTKFVPLVYSILEKGGVSMAPPAVYRVGDVVSLGSAGDVPSLPLNVSTPEGTEVSLSAGETNFAGTSIPGVYTVGSGTATKRFVVNVDPAESRTSPISIDEFEHLGVPLGPTAAHIAIEREGKLRLRNAELESRQKLWRWLIMTALVLLLGETWLAGRAARSASLSPDLPGAAREGAP